MTLSEELDRVREYLSGTQSPPSNEANTCSWAIRPLLHLCGYTHHEISEQAHDGAGKIPDFTLLPNTDDTWFLEAKNWSVELADNHVNQASQYANIEGKRWVVLCNGREWRLYDNYLSQVQPAERLVASARLDCLGELEALLDALSKTLVSSDGLEKFAQQSRLRHLLKQQFSDPKSDVLASVVDVLKKKHSLTVTPAEIIAYLQNFSKASLATPPLAVNQFFSSSAAVPAPVVSSGTATYSTLGELLMQGMKIQGRKPKALFFPNGTNQSVSTWAKLAVSVIEWLFANHPLPILPFRGRQKGSVFFINTVPRPTLNGKDRNQKIMVQGQTLYVDLNRSSNDFVSCLIVLCKEIGESPDGFRVELKPEM